MLEIILAENKSLKAEVAQLKATPPQAAVPAEPETYHIEIDAPPAVAEPTTQYAQPDSDTESLPAKRRARGNLRQFLQTNDLEAPDIIALQETRGQAKLSGYASFSDVSGTGKAAIATLIKRNIPALIHETGIVSVEHVLVEIIPTAKRGTGSLFVLNLLADLDGVAASIPTTEDYPAIDSRLAHLWAARTGLTNRWHKQCHNRRLRRRIAYRDREIEHHTTVLARQQWEQLCSGLSGQLGCKQSWHLLRHLLDPASAKSVALQQLQRVVRAYPGDTPSLIADLAAKYLQLPHWTPISRKRKPSPTETALQQQVEELRRQNQILARKIHELEAKQAGPSETTQEAELDDGDDGSSVKSCLTSVSRQTADTVVGSVSTAGHIGRLEALERTTEQLEERVAALPNQIMSAVHESFLDMFTAALTQTLPEIVAQPLIGTAPAPGPSRSPTT
ncbi:hypothetical protein HPB49_009451 [Dermacentor silvarum]|uniref:Uncharacterized protein n=1 Tax=Dermacentor silvarum TaxID=543639 RepID=A0ACB8C8I8_DERSI|nr:hypothetical protein HPB49_009451 [Dermacentor silvarum]